MITIDHVHNDGAAHRKQIGLGRNAGKHVYRWLKTNGCPPGFQTLCFNCNVSKFRNGGVCAHQAAHEGN